MSRVGRSDQGPPRDEPQGSPRDLHATSDIRFVMVEVAKLTQRIESLSADLAKVGPSVDKATEALSKDVKERVGEIKADTKKIGDDLREIEKSFSFFKGAVWVLGGLFAIFLVVVGVVLREWLTK